MRLETTDTVSSSIVQEESEVGHVEQSNGTPGPQPRSLGQSCAGFPHTHEARAGAVHRANAERLRRARGGTLREAHDALGCLDRLVPVRGGRRAAVGALLGHAPAARQHLRRAHARGLAARLALHVRDGARRAHVRAARQLRAGAHHAAGGRQRRPEAASLHHHRPARGARARHRGIQGRFAGGRRARGRASGVLRDLLSRAPGRSDHARRVHGRAGIRAQGPRAPSGEPEAGHRR